MSSSEFVLSERGIPPNRKVGPLQVLLAAGIIGAASYLLAEWLVPLEVSSVTEHDILLSCRLGFIYPPAVALWLAWLQRSWQRALLGCLVGLAIGLAYARLCMDGNFLAIMVGFPCLLGGGFAAAVGSNRSDWVAGMPGRLCKGLCAGLALGFTYMILLNLIAAMLPGNPGDPVKSYVSIMWQAGPLALAAASTLFFAGTLWAVGLTRVKITLESRE